MSPSLHHECGYRHLRAYARDCSQHAGLRAAGQRRGLLSWRTPTRSRGRLTLARSPPPPLPLAACREQPGVLTLVYSPLLARRTSHALSQSSHSQPLPSPLNHYPHSLSPIVTVAAEGSPRRRACPPRRRLASLAHAAAPSPPLRRARARWARSLRSARASRIPPALSDLVLVAPRVEHHVAVHEALGDGRRHLRRREH